ncbi:hypothetical protein HDE_04339 [Halotydeus destructor]|nr:hypothetical protein HDE_04339 [Halotydeus destructor]
MFFLNRTSIPSVCLEKSLKFEMVETSIVFLFFTTLTLCNCSPLSNDRLGPADIADASSHGKELGSTHQYALYMHNVRRGWKRFWRVTERRINGELKLTFSSKDQKFITVLDKKTWTSPVKMEIPISPENLLQIEATYIGETFDDSITIAQMVLMPKIGSDPSSTKNFALCARFYGEELVSNVAVTRSTYNCTA